MTLPECLKNALGLSSDVVEIERSGAYRWNAWVYYSNGFREFKVGLWWDYMKHVETCDKCRRKLKIRKREVQKELRKLEKEWKEVVG